VLIICLVVLATLLFCDAWFDVVLDARTAGFEISLLSVVVIELPPATLAGWGARRLLQARGHCCRRADDGQRHADKEDAPPSVAVTEQAGGQNRRGHRDDVSVGDPLQVRRARVRRLPDVRQRDAHAGDRNVGNEDAQYREADRQSQVTPGSCSERVGGSVGVRTLM
jgi:hypothetical protein